MGTLVLCDSNLFICLTAAVFQVIFDLELQNATHGLKAAL